MGPLSCSYVFDYLDRMIASTAMPERGISFVPLESIAFGPDAVDFLMIGKKLKRDD